MSSPPRRHCMARGCHPSSGGALDVPNASISSRAPHKAIGELGQQHSYINQIRTVGKSGVRHVGSLVGDGIWGGLAARITVRRARAQTETPPPFAFWAIERAVILTAIDPRPVGISDL